MWLFDEDRFVLGVIPLAAALAAAVTACMSGTSVSCGDGYCLSGYRRVTSRLHGIWCTGHDDVFAIGYGGVVLHHDGASWTEPYSQPGALLRAIRGIKHDGVLHIFAVGDIGVLHCDGTTWTQMPLPREVDLRDVWGTAYVDVFAVGAGGTLLRYDGASWARMPLPTDADPHGVWAPGATTSSSSGTAAPS
ncbi:hypothetical protein WME89_23310 [Sorangium sp. So ce321]|uniref:hypothetical protein n=1 Tax=Sorangium sp. So ce321 TaxID=3133300 RepID=UPI003F621124